MEDWVMSNKLPR